MLFYQANFTDNNMKFFQLKIQSKSLRKLRLVHNFSRFSNYGKEYSNLKQFWVDQRCSSLTEVYLGNFMYLQNVVIESKNVETLMLQDMSTKIQTIKYPSSETKLRVFSLDIQARGKASEILETNKNKISMFDGVNGLNSIKKFVFSMTFEQDNPNKIGVQWMSCFSPMYYTNAPEGHLWSKEYVSKYFPGLRKVLREDLF